MPAMGAVGCHLRGARPVARQPGPQRKTPGPRRRLHPPVCRPSPPQGVASQGRAKTVLDLLRSPRFADLAPAEIYATLLDEGSYHCSVSTMYRILHANSEVCARRKQLRHPALHQTGIAGGSPK